MSVTCRSNQKPFYGTGGGGGEILIKSHFMGGPLSKAILWRWGSYQKQFYGGWGSLSKAILWGEGSLSKAILWGGVFIYLLSKKSTERIQRKANKMYKTIKYV